MSGRSLLSGLALLLAAMSASACTSRDEKAATAAATAAAAFDAGQVGVARQQIGQALSIRDDVSDYWLLSARIALVEQNYAGAFDAYENVVSLDQTNQEALTRLCQIALSADQPSRAERYADRLAALRPGDKSALTVKAGLALRAGDKDGAARLLDQVLGADPADPLALILKSKLLASRDDFAGAAKAAEASLAAPGDLNGRLLVLRGLYLKTEDRDGYRRTIARLARAYPDAVPIQLDYAATLYDAGDRAGALAVSQRALTLRPDDVGVANSVLNMWLAQGGAAMPAAAILPGAADGSLPAKAAYAQYANEIGRPDLALQVLGDAAASDRATALNSDAKVARAYARALRGAEAAARAEIEAVLAVDEDHPRALLARGRMRARAGDRTGALEDLRHALAGDPASGSARLALAEFQLAGGDAVLAEATLREGLASAGADPRVALRLAALLRSQGKRAEASAALEDYRRANPFSRLARG